MGRRSKRRRQPLSYEESLTSMPPSRRPRMLSWSPGGWGMFQKWRTSRWFILMLVPVVAGTVSAWYRVGIFTAIAMFLFGMVVSASLFRVLCSGMESSNWGTYFRETEPIRYWTGVAILVVAYILCAFSGFLVQPK